MTHRCLVVDGNGVVTDILMWDGNAETWSPPEGHTVIPHEDGEIGWKWDGEKLIDPRPPVTMPTAPAPKQVDDAGPEHLA